MSSITPAIEDRGSPEYATKTNTLSILERARLAVHTLAELQAKSPTPVNTVIPPAEYADIQKVVEAAANPETSITTLTKNLRHVHKYSKAGVRKLDQLLSTLDEEILNSAIRIRTYATNKLLVESDDPDPKVRLKALELLGKIKEVGLFSDKLEITHKFKSDAELEAEIQNKLEIFMGNADIEDAEEVQMGGSDDDLGEFNPTANPNGAETADEVADLDGLDQVLGDTPQYSPTNPPPAHIKQVDKLFD